MSAPIVNVHPNRDLLPSLGSLIRGSTAVLAFGLLALPVLAGEQGGEGNSPPAAPGQQGGPVAGISRAQYRTWLEGRAVFDRAFSVAEGLGAPEFNADSCRACHQDPAVGGAGSLELNVSRFATDNGGAGPFMDLPGGQMFSKLRPPPDGTRENQHASADLFEQRQTPSILGDGLIETISDATILAGQDLTDANGDGIFGVARVRMIKGQPEVGRFGWKAQVPLLEDFVRDAMGGECGITTPDDGRGFAMLADADGQADPELTEDDVDLVNFFMQKLAAPTRDGGAGTGDVERGEELFSDLRCDRCHTPSLPGSGGPVNLFSNLLLHDVMGPGFSGMAEDGAPSGMYRTPPLWGIEDTAPYMHDGRASDLEAAVLAHQGEAAFSSAAYLLLTPTQQDSLIAFLEDL